MFRDVFAGRKPVYKLPVEFPAGCVVDVNDGGVCLVKTGIRNKAFNAIALAVTVLDVNKHPETIFKGDIFHLRVIFLDDKGI